MAGRLFLVPNLLGLVAPERVLPARTIEIARNLAHYLVENAKPARAFLKTLGPTRAIAAITIREMGAAPTIDACEALLAPARSGEDVGLLSDAGCPAVADPGGIVVAAAHRASIAVVPLVGPSSPLLALMASGLSGQHFAFHGYLPIKAAPREAALRAIDDEVARTGATQIFIETPYRNATLYAALLSTCRATTTLAIAVDLTLPTEWVGSRPIAEWRSGAVPEFAKRPAIFLLGRAAA